MPRKTCDKGECMRFDLEAENKRLKTELAEADRAAGEALRAVARFEENARRERSWLRKAKEDAGFHENVSFDDVWAKCLAAYRVQTMEKA